MPWLHDAVPSKTPKALLLPHPPRTTQRTTRRARITRESLHLVFFSFFVFLFLFPTLSFLGNRASRLDTYVPFVLPPERVQVQATPKLLVFSFLSLLWRRRGSRASWSTRRCFCWERRRLIVWHLMGFVVPLVRVVLGEADDCCLGLQADALLAMTGALRGRAPGFVNSLCSLYVCGNVFYLRFRCYPFCCRSLRTIKNVLGLIFVWLGFPQSSTAQIRDFKFVC